MLYKDNTESRTGFKLKQTGDKKWQLTAGSKVFEGDLIHVWQIMAWEFEFLNSEVRFAIEEMKKNNHNVAHFGIFCSFIFSEKE